MKLFNLVGLILGIAASLFFCGFEAYADELSESIGADTDAIYEYVSPEAEEFITENELSADNTEAMTAISFGQVMEYIWNMFMAKIRYPITVFSEMLCVIIICALMGGTANATGNKNVNGVFGIICTMAAAGIISVPLSKCVDTASETLTDGANFMIGYVPVYASITAASGSITSAVTYNAAVLLAAEYAVELASSYIMPLMSVCMALGIVEAVNPSLNLTSITTGITKAVKLVLGLVMTIFIGLLSLQSIIGTSADTVGVKAAKYMVSNFVPIIGGAVADAYTTLKNGLGVLRSGTGFFGIAILFITLLPSVLEIAAMRFAFVCAEIIAEIFGVKQLKVLAGNSSAVLSIMFSLIICFAVMLIIATAVLMLTGLNSF